MSWPHRSRPERAAILIEGQAGFATHRAAQSPLSRPESRNRVRAISTGRPGKISKLRLASLGASCAPYLLLALPKLIHLNRPPKGGHLLGRRLGLTNAPLNSQWIGLSPDVPGFQSQTARNQSGAGVPSDACQYSSVMSSPGTSLAKCRKIPVHDEESQPRPVRSTT